MKHILYLMHIPWGWIKQRPHFLAEHLAKHYIIDVYYRKANTVAKNSMLTKKSCVPHLSINGFNELPFRKIPILKYLNLKWINVLIAKWQIPNLAQYDYIWVTSPIQYLTFKPLLCEQKVIYDCMDDIIEFPSVKGNRRLASELLEYEKNLLMSADYVVVSSEYLKNRILNRADIERKNVIVVNNAIQLPQSLNYSAIPKEIEDKICYIRSLTCPFLYIGMISPWFDFDAITQALDKYPTLNIVLIGPCEVELPKNSRIHYLGIVERKYIFPLMKVAHALIMPFKLNDLIYAVNPVKLYEYIYVGKPVISIRYGETEKFSDYVHLYGNMDEWLDLVGDILEEPQIYTKEEKEIRCFIENNTWDARSKQIMQMLQS